MPRATHSTESHCRLLRQQCLPEAGPNPHCHTSARHPGGCLGHLPDDRAPRRCAQATTRTPGPPSTARSSWRSFPPASPWPCLAALILTVCLWGICQISSSAVSWGQRICGDTDEATSQQGGWIPNSSGYQETKPGGLGEQASGTQQNTCYSWKAPKGTAQAGYWLDNTHLGDFPETLYLNEQMKSKDLDDHDTSVHQMGARESGMAEDLSDKHTLGVGNTESWAPGLLPTATGPLSWSLRPCIHVGFTVTFSISWTKTST